MASALYAVVANGIVENIVVWDGDSEWSAPDGATAVPITTSGVVVDIGYEFDGANFIKPAPRS